MRALALALAAAATLGAAPAVAEPEGGPVPEPRPQDCRALAAAIGPGNVWWTDFSGERTNLWDESFSLRLTACFQTEAECRAWLYRAQSDYPEHMISTPCRRGAGP